jgi:hypothetical protein
MRNVRVLFVFVFLGSLLVGFVPAASARDLTINEYRSIAPRSIPVPKSGDPALPVAVTRLKFRNGGSGDPSNTSISRIDFQVTKTGGVTYAQVAPVSVLFETDGGAGTYDNGYTPSDDHDITTSYSYNTTTGAGYFVLNVNSTYNNIDSAGWQYLFIVLSVTDTADTASTIGCEITSLTYGPVTVGTGGTGSPSTVAGHNVRVPLDSYRANLAATGAATGSKDQGTTNVPVLKLTVTAADSSVALNGLGTSDMDLDKIRIHSLGDRDADISAAGVLLYEDDGDGNFEPGTNPGEDGEAIASGSLTAGYAWLNPPVDQFIGTSGKTFWVAVNVSLTSVVNDTIKLEVADPSTDLVFTDVIYDDNMGVLNDYACVRLGKPYVQKGYMTGTSATPTTGNSFTVTELYVPSAPTVVSIDPGYDATGVLRDANIVVTFSENMYDADTAVLTDADPTNAGSNFIVFVDANTNSAYDVGETIVAGTVSYAAKVATFNPTGNLAWGTWYTAIVSDRVKDDMDRLNLATPKIWSFRTQTAVAPVVQYRDPVSSATDVPRSAQIKATFSKTLVAGTIDDANTTDAGSPFTVFVDTDNDSVRDGGETIISGTVVYADPIATFTPSGPLAWGTWYTARIETTVTDTQGLTLEAAHTWKFMTVMGINPVAVSTDPAAGMTDVPLTSTVSVTFTKDMKLSTFVPGTSFRVEKDGGGSVGGVVDLPSANVARFTPSTALEAGALYNVTVTTAVTDTDDFPLVSNKTWSFREASRPAILLSTPANGALGVSRTATVKAVFSKDLDTLTILDTDTTDAGSNFIVFVDGNSNGAYDAGTDTMVPGSVGYEPLNNTATFTLAPGTTLSFTSYTVLVKAGATGIKDSTAIEMAGDVMWRFTTMPSLTEPVAANNKIVPGGTARTTIFIPEPPAGASAQVTVQVFTATGKRVATLVSGERYSDLLARLPLLWDGTNGKAQKLGPGLYFIRITATGGYSRVLKVMIVR